MPAPLTMLEWATSNCTAMNAPEDRPDTEVCEMSTLKPGSRTGGAAMPAPQASTAARPRTAWKRRWRMPAARSGPPPEPRDRQCAAGGHQQRREQREQAGELGFSGDHLHA